MPQWTAEQEKVISSDAGKLVCSAAAGSGKTAVMVERVVRMIESGKDPYSFLVITFTNAAAAEMKEKIRKRLLSVRKDPVMEVCTIHAFCQHLIRQEFQIAEVDPLFQICSTAQRESLFEDAFRKACDRLKKNEDREYLSFTEKYEPKEALEIVRTVYEFIRSLPEPFAWMEKKTEGVPLDYDRDHPWFVTVARMLEEQLVSARMILR
ncbi:MAG: UvrD-helicase domain-containing protein, partial [Eubacteriales bacterium]